MTGKRNGRNGNGELSENYSVRLTKEDSVKIRKIAKTKKCDVSDIFRWGLSLVFAKVSYADQEEKKILGFP